jgi:hypothetical protein
MKRENIIGKVLGIATTVIASSGCYEGYFEEIQGEWVTEMAWERENLIHPPKKKYPQMENSFVCPEFETNVIDAFYVPVCGEDGRNYPNVYSACREVDRFVYGKCKD